jgi:hypothetical protein
MVAEAHLFQDLINNPKNFICRSGMELLQFSYFSRRGVVGVADVDEMLFTPKFYNRRARK